MLSFPDSRVGALRGRSGALAQSQRQLASGVTPERWDEEQDEALAVVFVGGGSFWGLESQLIRALFFDRRQSALPRPFCSRQHVAHDDTRMIRLWSRWCCKRVFASSMLKIFLLNSWNMQKWCLEEGRRGFNSWIQRGQCRHYIWDRLLLETEQETTIFWQIWTAMGRTAFFPTSNPFCSLAGWELGRSMLNLHKYFKPDVLVRKYSCTSMRYQGEDSIPISRVIGDPMVGSEEAQKVAPI